MDTEEKALPSSGAPAAAAEREYRSATKKTKIKSDQPPAIDLRGDGNVLVDAGDEAPRQRVADGVGAAHLEEFWLADDVVEARSEGGALSLDVDGDARRRG